MDNNKNSKLSYLVDEETKFIFENWKFKGYNTQSAHTNNVVKFLNWIFITKKGNIKSNP